MKKYLQSIHTFCVVFDRQFCPHVDTTCSKINTCKTCDTFGGMGGQCTEIDIMPVSSRNMLFVIVRVTQAATPRPRFSLDIRSLSITSFSVIFIQNATIAEYGTYSFLTNPSGIVHQLQSEIYARGPVATGVNAEPIVEYTGGRVDDTKIWHMMVNHIVSIIGWETDSETGAVYWIVRNSWGR